MSVRVPSSFESTVRRLATIIGYGSQGAKLARQLAKEGVRTRAHLKRPEILARLSHESRTNVLYSPRRSVTLATATAIVAELKRRLIFDTIRATPEILTVGSVLRGEARSKDIDLLVVVRDQEAADIALRAAKLRAPRAGDELNIVETYAAGPRRRSFIVRDARGSHYRTDLFLTTAAEKPYAVFHYTGPASYNVRTRALAKRRGWRLNQYGIFDAVTGRRVPRTSSIRTERDLALFLGVTDRAPSDRK